MVFKYESNKLKKYRKNGIYAALLPFCIVAPLVLMYMYFGIRDIENSLLIILLLFIWIIICGGIGLLIGYKKAKKEFESYKIECNDEKIIITSNMQHKEIEINKITKILKDKNNYYIILSKINKIRIFQYVENIEEFEKYLNSIYTVEQYKEKYNILKYIPAMLYIALIFVSRYGNIKLYIVFAPLVFVTTLYSVIKLLFSQFKIRHKIIGLIVYGFILYGVLKGIYTVINYFLK